MAVYLPTLMAIEHGPFSSLIYLHFFRTGGFHSGNLEDGSFMYQP